MALINDPRLYSGGAVKFDQRPHVALYANLMQRKQARDEAFDEYIRNLNKTVNSAGVRNADRPIFDKQLQEWQKFGMENRDNIRGRKGGADIEFMRKFQDLQNIISESKTEEEKKKPLTEILLDPNKRDRVSDDIFNELQSHDEPLYIQNEDGSIERNPNRTSLDYSKVTFNPKPFEQDKYFNQFEDVKRTELPPVVADDPKTMTQTITTNSVYDQEAKDLIATRAVTDLMQNPSFRSVIKNLDPEQYNDFFKQNYGKDIENEADLAAAYTLKGLQQNVTTQKVSPDTYGRQVSMEGIRDANARRRLAIQQGYRKAIVDYRKAGTKQDQESILEGYINRAFDEGKDQVGAISVKGKWVGGRRILVPNEIKEKYREIEGDAYITPEKFIITEDKKYVVPVYPGRSSTKSTPIPIENFRNDLGKIWLTKKDAAGEMADELDFEDEEEIEEVPVSITPDKSSKPEQVEQGGHIFRLNKKTGEYEFVK